jgi:hypothetical protein
MIFPSRHWWSSVLLRCPWQSATVLIHRLRFGFSGIFHTALVPMNRFAFIVSDVAQRTVGGVLRGFASVAFIAVHRGKKAA